MYYIVTTRHNKQVYITEGETSTDALLTAYQHYAGSDRYCDHYDEAGGGNELAEQLKAEVFDVTETYRAMVLEYVERRLDGDRSINILL